MAQHWEVLDPVLVVFRFHNKPWAFTSSNYISEHLDCLFHSIHFEMKALSLFSFPFTWYKKRTFKGALPCCPWEISSTSNISSFEKKQWCGFRVYRGNRNSLCQTCSNKFCHWNAALISWSTLYVPLKGTCYAFPPPSSIMLQCQMYLFNAVNVFKYWGKHMKM